MQTDVLILNFGHLAKKIKGLHANVDSATHIAKNTEKCNTRLISVLRRATLNNEPVHVCPGIWAAFCEWENTRSSWYW
jgi:hypothetical protein